MAKNKKRNGKNEKAYDNLQNAEINEAYDDAEYSDEEYLDEEYLDEEYADEVYDDETAYDDEADYDDDAEYPDDEGYEEQEEYPETDEEYAEDEPVGDEQYDDDYTDEEAYEDEEVYDDAEEEYADDGEYADDEAYQSDEDYAADEYDDQQNRGSHRNNKQYIDDAFGDMWDERPEKKEHNGPKKPSVKPLVTCWILFAVLCIAYVYFFFIRDTSDKSKGNTGNTTAQNTEQASSETASTEAASADEVGKDNSVELDIPENASYKKCDDTAITDVINSFLTAKVNCDQAGLKACVLETENYDDMAKVNSAAEFIKEYKNVTCYVTDGYDDNGKVVFVLSNLVIADVDSNPLNIESFYVQKQSDGTYKINENRSTAVESYINNVIAKSDIQKIYAHVSENVQYLYNNDSTFKDFYDKIHPSDTDNSGDGAGADTTSEEGSETEASTDNGESAETETEASTEAGQ